MHAQGILFQENMLKAHIGNDHCNSIWQHGEFSPVPESWGIILLSCLKEFIFSLLMKRMRKLLHEFYLTLLVHVPQVTTTCPSVLNATSYTGADETIGRMGLGIVTRILSIPCLALCQHLSSTPSLASPLDSRI